MAVCLSLLYMGTLFPDTGSGLRAPGEGTPPTKKTPMFSDAPQVTHNSSPRKPRAEARQRLQLEAFERHRLGSPL